MTTASWVIYEPAARPDRTIWAISSGGELSATYQPGPRNLGCRATAGTRQTGDQNHVDGRLGSCGQVLRTSESPPSGAVADRRLVCDLSSRYLSAVRSWPIGSGWRGAASRASSTFRASVLRSPWLTRYPVLR